MYDFLNFEGDYSPSPKSKPLGCSEQEKVEEQGEEEKEEHTQKSKEDREGYRPGVEGHGVAFGKCKLLRNCLVQHSRYYHIQCCFS